jgi:proline iminopeptidase
MEETLEGRGAVIMVAQNPIEILLPTPRLACFVGVFLIVACLTVRAQEIRHPQGRLITVNGAKLWCETEGSGEPILLIPMGPGRSHDYFHPYFSVLAEKHEIIYFDPFGRGKSDRARSVGDYSFERDVEDIEGLRQALRIEKLIIVGHSYGGMVAIAYALKHPSSVQKLVLLNTQLSSEDWQAYADNFDYLIRNHFPDNWARIQELRAQGFHSGSPELQAALKGLPWGRLMSFYDASNRAKLNTPPDSFNEDVEFALGGDDIVFYVKGDLARLDFRIQVKDLKMPFLVVAGLFDRGLLPKSALLFKKYAPQADFIMMQKSGHFPWVEESAELTNILRRFLGK